MAKTPRDYFARIIALAHVKLKQIKIDQEINEDRAILSINGNYSSYRVFIKETISTKGRRYAYYILADNQVIVGLDNHADRQALRLKYGDDFIAHLTELIPHKHTVNKTILSLTDIWTAKQFLEGLEKLIVES